MTLLLRLRRQPGTRQNAALVNPDKLKEFSAAARQGSPSPSPPTFTSLPPEIHLVISRQLIYPDALSLKHTNRYFYYMVDTGVGLKVEWLMQRRQLHLDCPNNKKCDLGSDLRFCRGSVRLLMQRRREHMECESRPGLGCLVYGTPICTHRRTLSERWKRWMRRRLTIELWWILLALIPIFVAWLWFNGPSV